MKITVEIKPTSESEKERPSQVEIYCDQEGLESLIMDLSRLKKPGDHSHFMTPSWGMDDLCEDKVEPKNDLVHHLEVILI